MKSKKYKAYTILFLATLVIALYAPVRNFDFIGFDDRPYVSQNIHVLGGITWTGVKWAFTTLHEANWHPLTWLSLMLDGELYGGQAGGYHWTNVLFHLANALLLFLVFHGMTGALWRSGFVAALFAVHPLHVESVAWVAERKDVLSGFFWMVTLGFYWRYVKSPSLGRYGAVVASFVLGLMSKPMVVTLPLVLLLLDFWPLRRFVASGDQLISPATGKITWPRSSWFGLCLEKTPLMILSVLSSIVTVYAQSHYHVVASLTNLPLSARIENALLSYCLYIRKMFWPENLAVFYPHSVNDPLSAFQVTLLAIFLAAVTVAAVRLAKTHSYLIVGWLWYLGTLVPVIGLVQVGAQAMADRYAYLPLIGLYVGLVWGSSDLIRRCRYRTVMAGSLAVVTIIPLIVVTHRQIHYWQNGMTIFAHALAVTERNYVAENSLGLSLMESGRPADAVRHFEAAIRNNPDFVTAYRNLGVALQTQGRIEEAAAVYRREIGIDGRNSDAYYRLGLVLAAQRHFSEAAVMFEKAIALLPDAPGYYAELGTALTKLERYDEAKKAYKQALQLQSDHPGIHNNYAMLLMKIGDNGGAVEHFREALRLQPRYANAHYQLSVLYGQKGDQAAADRHLQAAIAINPEFRKKDAE